MASTAYDDTSTDEIQITVEDQSITCERKKLINSSDYFRAMFGSNMVECQTGKVTLHNQSYETVNTLINFIKTGEIEFERSTMMDIGEAAVMLQIQSAIDECEEFMCLEVDSECCLRLMHFAKEFNLSNTYTSARRHSLQYFTDVSQGDDFRQQDLSQIVDYLSDKYLNCHSELEVLDACVDWVRSDEAGRNGFREEVMSCIHPEDFTDKEWDQVKGHQMLKGDKGQQLVKTWLQIRGSGRKEKYRELPVVFMAFGGVIPGEINDTPCTDICQFDEETEEFTSTMSLRQVYEDVGLKMGYRVTVIGMDLYLSGGQPNLLKGKFEGLWVYEGSTERWIKLKGPSTPRRHHGACASEKCLFVLGGFGRYRQILDSVEQYDTIADKWTRLPKMLSPCFKPQVVYHRNKLYSYKTSVCCLDLNTLTWTTVRASIPCTMTTIQPIIVNDYIYEFPYFDTEFVWFSDFHTSEVVFGRYNMETQSYETIDLDGVDTNQFGNKVVAHGNRVYMISSEKEFVSWDLDNMKDVKKLGGAKGAGRGCDLIVLPSYSKYTADIKKKARIKLN